MVYSLNNVEKKRLVRALSASIAIPFIDDIEDYIVESIWLYTKDLKNPDPFYNIRSKRLFDVTDESNRIGWSVKSVQRAFTPGCEFELVIQRAAVYKKAHELGFSPLSSQSDPNIIGRALLEHWKRKVLGDAESQNVKKMRIMVLLKTSNKRSFAVYEDDLHLYQPKEVRWQWTNAEKNGLQGILKKNDMCVYRWYPSQAQFFERFTLPHDAFYFDLEPRRLTLESTVELLVKHLGVKQ